MHILCIGAHPDDCDYSIGGTAALFAQQGHHVKFVSVTNGDRGHYAPEYLADRNRLVDRRMAEAQAAVEVFGGEFECLDVHDGEVYITPELTERMIRLIRGWGPEAQGPDLVLLNRPSDYHRDHRYGAQVALDATYLLTVPLMCPDVRHLDRMPVFAYWSDRFREGGLFQADVVVDVGPAMDQKAAMVAAHESQFFEWLPYNSGVLESVPADFDGRLVMVRGMVEELGRRVLERAMERPVALVPPGCEWAEAFQISEYGRQPSPEELAQLFPFSLRAD